MREIKKRFTQILLVLLSVSPPDYYYLLSAAVIPKYVTAGAGRYLDCHAVGVGAEGRGAGAGVGNRAGAGFADVDLRGRDVKLPACNLTAHRKQSLSLKDNTRDIFLFGSRLNIFFLKKAQSSWSLSYTFVREELQQRMNPHLAFAFRMTAVTEKGRESKHLLHFRVDPLTHLRPAMSDQNRAVCIDVDQSSSLLTDVTYRKIERAD